ncbi:MAG: LuxR C-terminal-related transcriptional regulator, partial [Planctomycetaceae bacterium]|nr:LuxR C-terminal-related transcriptional regulator [Planctomycetaceae bacterium]
TQKPFRKVSDQLLDGVGKKNRWKYRVVEFTPEMRTAPKQDIIEIVRRAVPKRVSVRGLTRTAKKNMLKLTPRELEVFRFIVQGNSNKEIGKTLGIAADTVKEHIQRIFRKTSLTDRVQVALWAIKNEIAVL